MAANTAYYRFDLDTVKTGGSASLPLSNNYTLFELYTDITQTGSITVTSSGAAIQGVLYEAILNADITVSSGTFTFFGKQINAAYLINGTRMYAYYDGADFSVWVCPSFTTGLVITGDALQTDSVPINRLVNGTSGQVIVADGSGVFTAVGMTGDITVNSSGGTAIGNNKVLNAMLATGIDGAKISNGSIPLAALNSLVQSQLNTMAAQTDATSAAPVSSANIQTLNSVPITIVSGISGVYFEATDGICKINYSTAPYATDTDLIVKTAGASDAQLKWTGVLGATVNTVRRAAVVEATGATDTQLLANAALQLTTPTADPTAGGGTLNYIIFFRQLSF
jgi:hypothetical protein